jgi:hypothetical protein
LLRKGGVDDVSSVIRIYFSNFLSSFIVSIDTCKWSSYYFKISAIIGARWIGIKGD